MLEHRPRATAIAWKPDAATQSRSHQGEATPHSISTLNDTPFQERPGSVYLQPGTEKQAALYEALALQPEVEDEQTMVTPGIAGDEEDTEVNVQAEYTDSEEGVDLDAEPIETLPARRRRPPQPKPVVEQPMIRPVLEPVRPDQPPTPPAVATPGVITRAGRWLKGLFEKTAVTPMAVQPPYDEEEGGVWIEESNGEHELLGRQ